MNTTKKIYFLSAFVLIIGCLALNLSYSMFIQTEEKEIVSATIPKLAYTLETSTFTIPANENQVITLSINNSGNADINYGLTLLSELKEENKVRLVEETDNDIIGQIQGEKIKTVKLYVENEMYDEPLVLDFELIANYNTLTLDYAIDTKVDRINKYIAPRLLVDAIKESAIIAKNSNDPTRTQYVEPDMMTTTPGNTASTTEEKVLSYTDDNYTSPYIESTYAYYFRGAVTDNYVEFNDMCWRIVRTEGDGSVRIVLAAEKKCEDITDDDTTSAFIGQGMYGSKTKYGENDWTHSIAYYDCTYSNAMSTLFNAWFNGTKDDGNLRFSEEIKLKIKENNVCIGEDGVGDSSDAFNSSGVPISKQSIYDQVELNGYGEYYFRNYLNINDWQTYSLTCNSDSITTNTYKVAPLTAFEMIYAGTSANGTEPSNHYLIKNAEGHWWTSSICKYTGGGEVSYSVSKYGELSCDGFTGIDYVSMTNYLRPAVSLIEGTIANDGNGTRTNPYIIE